jgi:transketolase
MAVQTISQSGTMDELLNDAGIDAEHIVTKVKAVTEVKK